MSAMPASVFGQIEALAEASALSDDAGFSLPAAVIRHFEQHGIKTSEIETIIGPREDYVKAVESYGNLNSEQSDRASRLAHIVSLAERVFGKTEKALFWLRMNNRQLGNKPPVEIIRREAGARFVEEALMRIAHGIAA